MLEPALLDIRNGPGVQIACRVQPRESELRCTFHHAACDGLSAMDFIVDVLVGYANAMMGQQKFGLKPLDPQGLHDRGRGGVSAKQWQKWCLSNVMWAATAYRFYKRRPQPLFPHTLDLSQPPMSPSVRLHHFDPVESRQLRTTAQQAGTTVNTLLLRDLLLTLHQLRSVRGCGSNDDWFRVTIPLSMRSPTDRHMPAANLVSLGFVDRLSADLQEPDALLRGIDASLQRIIEKNWGLGFLTGMRVMQRFPQTLAKSLQRNRCFSTALFSNFGAALPGCCLPRSEGELVAGNLQVEDVVFVPLLRPLQLANLAVIHYAGRYAVSLRYDARHLRVADAQDFMNRYVARVRHSAGLTQG